MIRSLEDSEILRISSISSAEQAHSTIDRFNGIKIVFNICLTAKSFHLISVSFLPFVVKDRYHLRLR